MLLVKRIARRFVTINLRPVKVAEKKKMTWEELLFSSNLYSQYNIPRILKAEPRIESLMRDTENIDPNEEWFLGDMLKLLSLMAEEGSFPPILLEDLHRCLIKNANCPQFLSEDIFYSLSEFLDLKSNIPLLKNGRIQAYSRLYNKLNPFQREIIMRDYLETYRTGQFANSYIQDLDKDQQKEYRKEWFKTCSFPNRDMHFEYLLLQLKNRIAIEDVYAQTEYWNSKRVKRFQHLLDEYLKILEDEPRLLKIVKNYHSSEIFLNGINSINKIQIIQSYKQRLVKIMENMTDPDRHGLLMPKDQVFESVIMTNFQRNDRLLLQKVLKNLCELSMKRFPMIKIETLMLMEYCSYIHKGFLLLSFKSFYNKSKMMRHLPKATNLKPLRQTLLAGIAFDRLRFKKVLKDSIPKQQINEFVDLYIQSLRSFIFIDKPSISVDYQTYFNINIQYLNPTKHIVSPLYSVGKTPETIQKLIHYEKSLGIHPIVDYHSDFRLESEIIPLSLFVLQLQALEASLSMVEGEYKYGTSAFKQMSNSISQIKTSLNYICMPRVFDTFIRLKSIIKKKLRNIDWNLIDVESVKRIRAQFNEVWNNLQSISKRNEKTFRIDPKYKEYLFDIEPSFIPPLLLCGKSTPVVINKIDLNFTTNFTCNEKHILQNVSSNPLLPILYEQSMVKDKVQSLLSSEKVSFNKNFVDYPYFADFLIQSKKAVVLILDYAKSLMSCESKEVVGSKIYDESESFWKQEGYTVLSVSESDLKEGELKSSIVNELKKLR